MKDLKPVYLIDSDSILPQVLVIHQQEDDNGQQYLTSMDIYSTLEAATSEDYQERYLGCLAEDIDLSTLPGSSKVAIHGAVAAYDEQQRRHRVLDKSLRETLKSIMAGGL